MNIIVLSGRLTKDVDVRYTQDGKCVAMFTLAVDRVPTKDGKREADFINCVAFQKTAETLGNYVSKGRKIVVNGHLRVRTYDNKEGKKVWATEVIIMNFEFADSKGQQGQNGGNNQQANSNYQPFSQANTVQQQAPQRGAAFDTMGQAFDETIPF